MDQMINDAKQRFNRMQTQFRRALEIKPTEINEKVDTFYAMSKDKFDELDALECKVATLSVDPVKSHTEWLDDVVAHCENEIDIKFPIIGDADRSISTAYGMIDPGTSGSQDLPLTIRAVFIINPENKLMLSLNYPACVGRNMDEIVRCVKALQLSYEKSSMCSHHRTHNARSSTWPGLPDCAPSCNAALDSGVRNSRDTSQLAEQPREHWDEGFGLPAAHRLRRGGVGALPRLSHARRALEEAIPPPCDGGDGQEGGSQVSM